MLTQIYQVTRVFNCDDDIDRVLQALSAIDYAKAITMAFRAIRTTDDAFKSWSPLHYILWLNESQDKTKALAAPENMQQIALSLVNKCEVKRISALMEHACTDALFAGGDILTFALCFSLDPLACAIIRKADLRSLSQALAHKLRGKIQDPNGIPLASNTNLEIALKYRSNDVINTIFTIVDALAIYNALLTGDRTWVDFSAYLRNNKQLNQTQKSDIQNSIDGCVTVAQLYQYYQIVKEKTGIGERTRIMTDISTLCTQMQQVLNAPVEAETEEKKDIARRQNLHRTVVDHCCDGQHFKDENIQWAFPVKYDKVRQELASLGSTALFFGSKMARNLFDDLLSAQQPSSKYGYF